MDSLLAQVQSKIGAQTTCLLTFLFHGLFQDAEEAHSGNFDPQQGITAEMFRQFVQHFKEHAYEFVTATQIVTTLEPGGRYVLLTFDDGYYNNFRALEVLEEFNVPATVFVSTNHIRYGKSFWWDAIYREQTRMSRSHPEIQREIESYKKLRTCDIESRLRQTYGDHVLTPEGDSDRPLSPAELRHLSSHPLITIGNHTCDHAILTNYSEAEQREQIQAGQDDILEMCGRVPIVISYPNGNASKQTIALAASCGLQVGVSCRAGHNRTPVAKRDIMLLKRNVIWGDQSISAQCKVSQAPVSLYRTLQSVRPLFAS
jgi:peptidoglycan/xylan/chitin deacetylase (PgdA/CDA1 family)